MQPGSSVPVRRTIAFCRRPFFAHMAGHKRRWPAPPLPQFHARGSKRAGVTLIEVLIAVSLLSLLSVGMLFALRVGLNGLDKANKKLMDNRRVTGAQRILEQQLGAFMPAKALCAAGTPSQLLIPLFQGEPQSMRFVSTYSIEEAARGYPRLLEFQVIPREDGRGLRLVVNEHPYGGPQTAAFFCLGVSPSPQYRPIEAGPASFVLADRLASCRFSYQEMLPPPDIDRWVDRWIATALPQAVRIELRPLEPGAAGLQPLSVTTRLHVDRLPNVDYNGP